jgi:hypothetical protein
VALSITSPVIKRAEDLNTLTVIYNEDAAADKNFISENTPFIADRLELITQELRRNRTCKVSKKSNQLTDIESEGNFL